MHNNPINLVDPLGLDDTAQEISKAGKAAEDEKIGQKKKDEAGIAGDSVNQEPGQTAGDVKNEAGVKRQNSSDQHKDGVERSPDDITKDSSRNSQITNQNAQLVEKERKIRKMFALLREANPLVRAIALRFMDAKTLNMLYQNRTTVTAELKAFLYADSVNRTAKQPDDFYALNFFVRCLTSAPKNDVVRAIEAQRKVSQDIAKEVDRRSWELRKRYLLDAIKK